MAISGIVEVHPPFEPGIEPLRRPEPDILPAAAKPIGVTRPQLKLLHARRQRKTGAFCHERAVEADTIGVESTEVLFLLIAHSEIWKVLQGGTGMLGKRRERGLLFSPEGSTMAGPVR